MWCGLHQALLRTESRCQEIILVLDFGSKSLSSRRGFFFASWSISGGGRGGFAAIRSSYHSLFPVAVLFQRRLSIKTTNV